MERRFLAAHDDFAAEAAFSTASQKATHGTGSLAHGDAGASPRRSDGGLGMSSVPAWLRPREARRLGTGPGEDGGDGSTCHDASPRSRAHLICSRTRSPRRKIEKSKFQNSSSSFSAVGRWATCGQAHGRESRGTRGGSCACPQVAQLSSSTSRERVENRRQNMA